MTIRTRVEDYLAMRRSLGYTLRGDGRMLLDFADRLDQAGQSTITVSAVLAWATESEYAAPAQWRRRLGVVRVFARHLHALDPSCEIPSVDLLPGGSHRPAPYIIRPKRSPRSSTPHRRSRHRCRRPPATP